MVKKMNKDLTAEQKLVLFEDGTERPGTSELNYEKREGSYHCVNCNNKLRFLPNALLTPHIGYVTVENYSIYYTQMLENLEACIAGEPIREIK